MDLFPYQIEGKNWLKTKKLALLGHEMGLGKSAMAITAADEIGAKRILVICPAIARYNWHREFTKFSTHNRVFDIVFNKSYRPVSNDRSVIISYDLALKFLPSELGHFDLLILDEAHYLKTLQTKRTLKVYGKEGFVRFADRVWCLTGTPAPNHAGELYPLLFTFGCVANQSYDSFTKEFCDTIPSSFTPNKRQIVGTKKESIPKLRQILSKIMLRRTQKEIAMELPEIFFSNIVVEPGEVDFLLGFPNYMIPRDTTPELFELIEKQAKLIDDLQDAVRVSTDGMKILEGLAKSVSTLRMYTGLQKVQEVASLVHEELLFGQYDKIVIFAIHRGVIKGLQEKLKDFGVVTLYGGTPPEKRQRNIDSFQKNPRCKVFIGNIQASGTAITLTAANQVIFAEQDWVPGNNAQAAKRCHRIGQERPVFVRFVALKDSYDERIAQILRRKSQELSELFENSLPSKKL